jgi:phosphatidate cytidylyltransferase
MLSANLKQRILSASLLAPFILWAIYHGGAAFATVIILLAILMSFEWKELIAREQAAAHTTLWQCTGITYIALPTISLLWLRSMDKGFAITFWLILCVWATDIAAYFAGRAFGGWKLMPRVSPSKTWSGLAGGIVGAAIIGALTAIIMGTPHPVWLIIISGFLAIIAQIGDLFESWVKRFFGVKDSGTMLPGHGGILDRVDGIVTVAPFVALLMLLTGGNFF